MREADFIHNDEVLRPAQVCWILKGFIEDLPREIEEAAKVDGARPFQVFRMIVLPLAAPGLVVAALFTFVFAWNDFAYAVIFSGSKVTPYPL